MERVETLLKKLQEQFAQQANADQLLLTVQMLQAELLHLQKNNTAHYTTTAITIAQNAAATPAPVVESVAAAPVTNVPPAKEERTVEVLQVNEEEIEAELEEIRRNAEILQKISSQNKPHIIFEKEKEIEIPTLVHQQQPKQEKPALDINEVAANAAASVNDKLKQTKVDLGESLIDTPIRDLKKAIGINDRFLYINELFRGDEAAYERSIKTINGFSILPEAEYWIQRELKVKNGWIDSQEVVKQFYQLVKRRFS